MLRARKSLGQHFLRSPHVICRILEFGRVQPGEPLLEVGPGTGALTRELLLRSDDLIAVEVDEELAETWLRPLFCRFPRAQLYTGDIRLFEPEKFPGFGRRKVFGNLPYNIATHLILTFAEPEWRPFLADMIFMVQKEVGERIRASSGSREYGYLSCICQLAFRVESGFTVSRGAFSPRPAVDSIVLRLAPRPGPPWDPALWALLQALLKQAFSQRRKTIRNCLKKSQFDPAPLTEAGIAPTARPEQLPPETYVRLARLYAGGGVSNVE